MTLSAKQSYRTSLWFGAAPLTIGIAIFIGWLLFRSDGFVFAGLVTLCMGLFAFLAGVACLFDFLLKARRDGLSGTQVLWRFVLGAALLIVNFPVAGWILMTVNDITFGYVVVVVNEGPVAIDEFRVFDRGGTVDFGTIAPGATVNRLFHVKSEGPLACRGLRAGAEIHAVIDGYATGLGGNRLVKIKPDGNLEVVANRD
jgi:hypothetical protein